MSKYLIKFKPLEPYFFGGENTFRMDESNRYYITSLLMPSQSTIIGTLRYEILKQNDALKPNGRYTKEEKGKCDELIGANSYTVGANNNLGKIKDISPIFLTDSGNGIYIRTPLNCKVSNLESEYVAIELSDEKIQTSHGEVRLPINDEYSPKKNVSANSFMRLSDRKIHNNLFTENENVGIDKAKKKEAFFKKKFYSLDAGYSFAVVAEIEDSVKLENGICYMGRGKSAFALIVEETELDIEAEIKKSLSNATSTTFYYVFGDMFVTKEFSYSDFAVVGTDTVRMLTTTSENNNLKISCINKFHQIIRAGSALYANDIECTAKYGFNNILEISGGNE